MPEVSGMSAVALPSLVGALRGGVQGTGSHTHVVCHSDVWPALAGSVVGQTCRPGSVREFKRSHQVV